MSLNNDRITCIWDANYNASRVFGLHGNIICIRRNFGFCFYVTLFLDFGADFDESENELRGLLKI